MELEHAYTEPHRRYHTLTHIDAVLHNLGAHHAGFNDPAIAELALFYHDLVYDPARHDNEAQSAARLKIRLSPYLDAARLRRACSHIEATRHHDPTPDPDTNLVLDLDMSILGAGWPDYLAYAQGVHAEYAPVYGAEAYAAGRVKLFLEPTLARDRIFLTAPLTGLEFQARDNLARERRLWLDGAFPGASA
jgi:predicted metal-dependent HD superfamily phosphohydrolase